MTFNYVTPKNRKEAKLWNYLNSAKWDFYPIRIWPRDLAEATLAGTLRNPKRFRMFLYFVGNGMAPKMARESILKLMVAPDADAKRHLEYLEKNIDRYLKLYSYWDESTGSLSSNQPEPPERDSDGWALGKGFE